MKIPSKSGQVFTARVIWCPNGCGMDTVPRQPLIRRNISLTHAEKGCKLCKRKFRYIRTDTPEGRVERVKAWREEKRKQEFESENDASGTVLNA